MPQTLVYTVINGCEVAVRMHVVLAMRSPSSPRRSIPEAMRCMVLQLPHQGHIAVLQLGFHNVGVCNPEGWNLLKLLSGCRAGGLGV